MIEPRTVPGVYIKELNAFPNSAVQVATAIPVFIGYTQTNTFQGKSLKNKPVQLTSLADYVAFFESGGSPGPQIQYVLTEADPTKVTPDIALNGKSYTIAPDTSTLFYMYNSVQLFFQNGGSTCYVISIGTYADGQPKLADYMPQGKPSVFDILKGVQDPTMILIPDALLFAAEADYYSLMNQSLQHCSDVQSRMTIMDIWGADKVTDPLQFLALQASNADPISSFRNGITSPFVNYGACYYPFVNTNVVSANNITFANIKGGFAPYADSDTSTKAATDITNNVKKILALPNTNATEASAIHNALLATSPNYQNLMKQISLRINCLPVAPAVAGAIAVVDSTQGVWKAPANIGLISVQSPVLNIDDDLQSNMNVDAVTGKSVNAIRPFTGFGVLIWGARTLDGNSQDWRYISVRRTLIMIEQSVKLATRAYVFANNDANTWLNLKSMIENFLTGVWKQGGLAGASPAEAFSVFVGLGSTMTAQDILDGYLDVSVLVAVTHPAEFIEITFQQQLQKS